ncbi:MAG: cardiolipin synthase [Bacilli bacterium]|jgi:cardiolipin synthase|nr:cardiolipin synthase [Bacilli bacterium]
MKLFKNGYWPKFLMLLLIFLQLVGLGVLSYYFFNNSLAREHFYSLAIAVWAITAAFEIFIVLSRSETSYRIAWMLLVALLPVLGALYYLLFANKRTTIRQRKRMKRYETALPPFPSDPQTKEGVAAFSRPAAAISQYLESNAGAAVYEDTAVEYFPLGDQVFPVILRELRKARHFILFEFFIIAPGLMWDAVHSILVEKAQEGVEVKLVYDDLGNLGNTPVDFAKKLNEEGIKTYVFSPIKPFLNVKMNNRDHRKIIVIDGHTGFTGGINIADEYINRKARFGHWKDNCIMLRGRAVSGFSRLFLQNWVANFEKGWQPDFSMYESGKYIDEIGGYPKSDGFLQPYGDVPFDYESVGERVYLSILGRALRYVYISTPYLILDSELINAITLAKAEGVDVRLLVPGIPDKRRIFQLTRANYGPLLAAGVRIYEYTPGFVHQKMFVCDDEVATDGTINLDYRSLYLHLECGTLLVGSRAIDNMKSDFLATLETSHEVSLEEWKGWHAKKAFEWALLRLLAPLL